MGAWGPGLYANDDAADFVDLVRAVLRLPKPLDELVALLRSEAEGAVEDETTSTLILADQLEKQGIHHPETFAKAIEILEDGRDTEAMRRAEMDEKDLKARAKSNLKILDRLKNPRPERPRKTLAKPQTAVVSRGDYVCFPTRHGMPRNPYFPPGREEFEPDAWGVVQIHDVGWEFEYLNWVKVLPLNWGRQQPPGLQDAVNAPPSGTLCFGTLPRMHFKRMEMQIIGNQPPRPDAAPPGPDDRTARFVALNDVSICNLPLGSAL